MRLLQWLTMFFMVVRSSCGGPPPRQALCTSWRGLPCGPVLSLQEQGQVGCTCAGNAPKVVVQVDSFSRDATQFVWALVNTSSDVSLTGNIQSVNCLPEVAWNKMSPAGAGTKYSINTLVTPESSLTAAFVPGSGTGNANFTFGSMGCQTDFINVAPNPSTGQLVASWSSPPNSDPSKLMYNILSVRPDGNSSKLARGISGSATVSTIKLPLQCEAYSLAMSSTLHVQGIDPLECTPGAIKEVLQRLQPDAPAYVNITLMNATAVNATWPRPRSHGGCRNVSYMVTLFADHPSETLATSRITTDSSQPFISKVFGNLSSLGSRPFLVSVAAWTEAGEADLVSSGWSDGTRQRFGSLSQSAIVGIVAGGCILAIFLVFLGVRHLNRRYYHRLVEHS